MNNLNRAIMYDDDYVDMAPTTPTPAEEKISVSAASLERLKQGHAGLLKRRQQLADELRELETQIARQEGGIQLMQLLVDDNT